MIKRTKEPWKGLWGFPGGHVDEGEPLQKAILREVKEETGLNVSAGEKPLEIFLYPVLDHYHKSHLFKCRITGSSKLKPSLEWRHEGILRWCKKTQKNFNPIVGYVLKKYVN